MFKSFPRLGESLKKEHLSFLGTLSKSCRNSIVSMTTNAKSGHPGGSCSVIDYLSLIYAFIVSQTGEDVVVSNGHVSPAVYSVLAEMGYIPKEEVVKNFRKSGSVYEGHVTRHVPGIAYGTGPLGIGVSVAAAFAQAEKRKAGENQKGRHVFAVAGDGECEEGQVYEMMHYAAKYQLSNLILFIDYNEVQLSDALSKIMPIDLPKIFDSGHWNVIECDGHDYQKLWKALGKAMESLDRPTVIIGKTVMGKGVSFMEPDGLLLKSTWHGVAPKQEQTDLALLGELKISPEEETILETFRKTQVKWVPKKPEFIAPLTPMVEVRTGIPKILPGGTSADCRTAYGKALKDLADLNPNVVAFTADLKESVKTNYLEEAYPDRHFDVGIAEQHMVSAAGGISLHGYIPFASTFGAFLTSRAKDQARVNDINQTNLKMVATHCGLSVGEDGPTHQVIDDMGSMEGFLNTAVLEPADANQTDHIIRFVAGHYGNFYVRMGRHKFNVITKGDGTPFYDENYKFEYGKADLLRNGTKITVVASGSMVSIAIEVADKMKGLVEVVAVSSIKAVDRATLGASLKKTGKLITLEDHNPYTGLGASVKSVIAEEGWQIKVSTMAVREYQLSGTSSELYEAAGIGPKALESEIQKMLQ